MQVAPLCLTVFAAAVFYWQPQHIDTSECLTKCTFGAVTPAELLSPCLRPPVSTIDCLASAIHMPSPQRHSSCFLQQQGVHGLRQQTRSFELPQLPRMELGMASAINNNQSR